MNVLKKVSLLFIYVYVIISCKNSIKESNIENTKEVVSKVNKQSKLNNERNIDIITGLNKLKQAINNSDRKELSSFFVFPTKKLLFIPIRNDIKDVVYENDSIITKDFFLKNCYIPKADYNPSLNNLLKELNLNLLKTSDVVEKSLEVENDECSYYYKIEVSNGTNVKLEYKSIANPKYEDNEYTCEPENDIIYMKLEGNRLLFDQDKIEINYERSAG